MASIDELSKEITKALKAYTAEVTEGMEDAKVEIAKKTAKHLRGLSHPKLTGKYAKGWAVKKVGTAYIIHNQANYQLTHLLEKGHAKKGGGRVKAIPHIGPAEEKAIEEYMEKVEKVIKG